MTDDRKKYLQSLVNQRFKDISTEEARAAYAEEFPFGISGRWTGVEEREFIEAHAKAALDAKVAQIRIRLRCVEGHEVQKSRGELKGKASYRCDVCEKHYPLNPDDKREFLMDD